jgi:hypothetical protein
MTTPEPNLPSSLDALLEEQGRRCRQGERVLVEPLLDARPELHGQPELVLDLIYHEMFPREQAGKAATLTEYVRRLPPLADALHRQLEIHRALGGGAASGPSVGQGTTGRDTTADGAEALPTVAEGPLPGYDLLGVLWHGGMGVVYRARHHGLGLLVALKMIRGGAAAGPEELQRFRTEAEAIASLQHPHIV